MKLQHSCLGKKRVFAFSFILLLLCLFPVFVSADTKSILSKFPLQSNSPVNNVLRSIGWSVVCFLDGVVSGLEGAIYGINDAIGGFFTSDLVSQLNKKVFPLAMALMLLVILYIGLLSMFKPPKFTAIVQNFVIGIIVFISLPCLLQNAYDFTIQAISYINGGSTGSLQLMSDRILVDNITDTTRYDAEGFRSTTLKYKSYFAMSNSKTSEITGIDINELVDPDKMKHSDVWKNRIGTDANGSTKLVELNSGQYGIVNIPIFSEYYYRWNVDWFTIFSTLIVTAIALLLSGIKIARLLYELAINQTMAQVMGLLDIVTAQRLKKCIQLLISTLGTLFAIFYMLQLYIIGTSYVSSKSNWNMWVRLIIMIALAFAVVDGPNLFEQIFGIDVGMKSGLQTMYGLKAAGSLITGGMALVGGKAAMEALGKKGLFGVAKGMLGKAGGAAGSIGGTVAGIASGAAQNSERVNAVKQGFAAAAGSAAGAAIGGIKGGKKALTPEQVSAAQKIDKLSSLGKSSNGAEAHAAKQKAHDMLGKYGLSMADVRNVKANGGQAEMPGGNPIRVSDNPYALATIDPEQTNGLSSYEEKTPGLGSEENDSTGTDRGAVGQTSTSTQSSDTGKEASQKGTSAPAADSIGGYLHSRVSNGVRQSGPYTSTRRMYSLTRGSMDKRGDKLVEREKRAQTKMQNSPDLSHHQAIREAKKEMKNENMQSHFNQGAIKNDVQHSKAAQRRE